MAEGEGFEPSELLHPPVFKTGALGRYANLLNGGFRWIRTIKGVALRGLSSLRLPFRHKALSGG